MSTTPRRIEWEGPSFWTVWADEDGVHVRSRGGDGLEEPEFKRLFDLWHAAKQQVINGRIPAPAPAPARPDLPF